MEVQGAWAKMANRGGNLLGASIKVQSKNKEEWERVGKSNEGGLGQEGKVARGKSKINMIQLKTEKSYEGQTGQNR